MKKQLLLFVMTLLPMVVMAEDSNICGDNITWTYTDYNNTLTISGYGEMYDYYDNLSGTPWYSYRNEIKNIVINDGVTLIGSGSFGGCKNLVSVTIPNSIKTIGWIVFDDCESLRSIFIPQSVTRIGGLAFRGCKALTTVSIESIESWCSIDFDDDLSNPLAIANHLYLDGNEIKDLIIPDNVTSIGKYAFYGFTNLNSVFIPNDVVSIGNNAFNGCSGLTAVSIPNSAISIGLAAFAECSKLSSVTIGNSVSNIGVSAFEGCSHLTSVKSLNPIPPKCGKNAFDTFTASLYVPQGSIIPYKAADVWRNFVVVREITDDDEDTYLTINDGAHGNIKLKIDNANPFVTIKFEADNGWQLFSVTLNDENVTAEVGENGLYTTPAINSNSKLTVIYTQSASLVPVYDSPQLHFSIFENSIVINGTKEGDYVRIFTLDGKSIVNQYVNTSQIEFSLNANRTYIVKVNEQIYKISM